MENLKNHPATLLPQIKHTHPIQEKSENQILNIESHHIASNQYKSTLTSRNTFL